jgi:hypothetical protein
VSERINPWKKFHGSMLPEWLEPRPELSPGAKMCYARLTRYAGNNGKCYPRQKTIASALGVSDRQVRNYLTDLAKWGLIEQVKQTNKSLPDLVYFLDHPWMHGGETEAQAPTETDQEAVQEPPPPQEKSSQGGDGSVTPGSIVPHPPELSFHTPWKDISGQKESHGKESLKGESLGEPSLAESLPLQNTSPSAGEKSKKEIPPDVGKTPTLSPSSLDQSRLDAITAASKQRLLKHRSEQVAKKEKKARLKENLQGQTETISTKKFLDHLQVQWREDLKARWPEFDFARWEPKERKQLKEMIQLYSGPVVEYALHYMVRQWDQINDRFFRGKGSFPRIGTLRKFHDALIPEAQQWEKVRTVRDEYDAWCKEHPHDLPPPELKARYSQAEKAMEALGL